VKVSVEEENPDGADGVPVFPHAQVSATPAAQDECAHSRGKKTVQRTNSVLGSGSYGEVSVVKHKGICYAAKELKLEDSALVDNLYREAANLALLDDDNIVKFCGIGVYEKHHRQGVFLILTELLATSLHRYLMKGVGISLPNQVSLLSQVLSGLEYMHQAPSVIHGDLKTRNVLLSEKGIAKIGDLGSSHLANDSIVGQDVCGTEAYMAPEMASGDYTKKMDVFAYGHLALVTLTRWEVDTAEFSTPKPNSPNKEIEKRKKLFAMLKRPTYAVVGEFVPLIRACLCDKPAERLALDRLKDQMQDLRLPRELPNVQTDTAVREI
jgi:serine/threonine protein kinase